MKSGGVERGDIAKLKGDMQRVKAVMGVLITLEDPTKGMRAEAKKAGLYAHDFTGIEEPVLADVLERGAIRRHRLADGCRSNWR